MAIQPLQLPQLINVPQLNFAPLNDIGDAIAGYRQRSALADSLPSIMGQQPQQPQGNSLATLGQPQPAQPSGNAAAAIGGIESSGNYGAVGPATRTGDRAFGKYQVMGANIGPWTQEVLGQTLTPQQFLASPQAQDAVFNAKFGQYAQKYGPEGAAKAWFAGEGGMNNPNAKDQNGTTVSSYAKRFDVAFNGNNPPLPSTITQGSPTSQPGGAGLQPSQAPSGGQPASQPQAAPAQPQQTVSGQTIPPDTMARIQAMIRAGGPAQQFAMALLQKYVVPQTPVVIGEGGVAVNPVTGQVIARGQPKSYAVQAGGELVTPGAPGAAPGTGGASTYQNTNGVMSDQAIALNAERAMHGDFSALSQAGRGTIGQINNAKIMDYMAAHGATPEQLNLAKTEFEGLGAAQKALGTQEAKVGSAAFEAGNAINLARGAIDKVSRTNSFGGLNSTFNQLQQLYDEHKLNPNQTELYVRAQGVINTYATVMSRNGAPTDAARAHAEALLDTAGNSETWNRALDTLQSEIDMAKKSPEQMRQFYRDQSSGKGTQKEAPTQPKVASSAEVSQSLSNARAAVKGGKWTREQAIKKLIDGGIPQEMANKI